MGFLTDWITNIIVFILLAIIMDMLLPNTEIRKYAKMVIGLLLITVLITPIFKLLKTDFEAMLTTATSINYVEQNNMENLIESKKKEIQAAQNAYILEEMAVQLKKDGEEELINRFNYEISHINVHVKDVANPELPKDLTAITVILDEIPSSNETIETVKEVEIDLEQAVPVATDESMDIKQLLAQLWEVDEELIQISFERRSL
ncbi:MAG: stage III sporulation protein AF [Bacillus sp. (in: firmicutes)]